MAWSGAKFLYLSGSIFPPFLLRTNTHSHTHIHTYTITQNVVYYVLYSNWIVEEEILEGADVNPITRHEKKSFKRKRLLKLSLSQFSFFVGAVKTWSNPTETFSFSPFSYAPFEIRDNWWVLAGQLNPLRCLLADRRRSTATDHSTSVQALLSMKRPARFLYLKQLIWCCL